MDEKEEMKLYKQKLVEEFEKNKKDIWAEKKWDPEKYSKKSGDKVVTN